MKDHTFVAKIEKMGMKDGVVSLQYNAALAGRIPPEVKAKVDAAQQAILAGNAQRRRAPEF